MPNCRTDQIVWSRARSGHYGIGWIGSGAGGEKSATAQTGNQNRVSAVYSIIFLSRMRRHTRPSECLPDSIRCRQVRVLSICQVRQGFLGIPLAGARIVPKYWRYVPGMRKSAQTWAGIEHEQSWFRSFHLAFVVSRQARWFRCVQYRRSKGDQQSTKNQTGYAKNS